jgi:hypothetical protein
MPIRLVEKNGLTCVEIACEVCGKQIAIAEDGFYMWNMDNQAGGAEPLFVHRGNCAHQKVIEKRKAGWLIGDAPLTCFIVYMLTNLGANPCKKLPNEWIDSASMFSSL